MELVDWLDALRPSWMNRGACIDAEMDVFFPSTSRANNPGRNGYSDSNDPTSRARRICAGCPVRDECLEYALVNNIDHGVWGGESERSRRRMRRARRLAA